MEDGCGGRLLHSSINGCGGRLLHSSIKELALVEI